MADSIPLIIAGAPSRSPTHHGTNSASDALDLGSAVFSELVTARWFGEVKGHRVQIGCEAFELLRLRTHRSLRPPHKSVFSAVNYDVSSAAALCRKHLGDHIMINAVEARIEWAARVARQSEEMIIIASATCDHEMKNEFLGLADRLAEQVIRIRSLPSC